MKSWKTVEWVNFTKSKKIISFIWSGSCLAVILLRFIKPTLLFDQYTLIVLGIGFLPWLPFFYSKIKFPGGGELVGTGKQGHAEPTTKPPEPEIGELSVESKQGKTETKPTELGAVELGGVSLSPDAKKVMATLWRYQQQNFQNDFTKRWTFLIYPGSKEFIEYMSGVAELLKYSFIQVRADNSQTMLTNEGIIYIQQHKEIQEYKDFYNF